ncbi:MAG: MFS transporter [Trueperaceae bacterium]|nr:MFS transporter [Trueperaceae bacterium]
MLAGKSLTKKRVPRAGIWGWMLFDWATQPFYTLILTFVFAPYFASTVAPNAVAGQALWGQAAGVAGFIIALMAPILGAIADTTGARKPWIFIFSILYVIGSFFLWYALPESTALFGILLALFIGLVGAEFTTVFTNAMMPDLVPRAELGKLSGTGWALGYVGGLVSLILVLGFMSADAESGKTLLGITPIFGLDPVSHQGDRASGPLTAIWYILFILPLFFFTPDVPRKARVKGAVVRGLRELGQTLKTLPQNSSLFAFLIASMSYRDGLNAIYTFGGIYAAGVLGWSVIQVGTFGIIAAFTGALGAWFGGHLDVRFGPKPVVSVSIVILALATLTIISTGNNEAFFVPVAQDSSLPDLVFYIAGAIVGAAGGSVQASSRTLLVDQAEKDRMTEAFGLYALTGKATSFLGPLGIAWMTSLFNSQRLGVSPVLALLLIGLVLLGFVKKQSLA